MNLNFNSDIKGRPPDKKRRKLAGEESVLDYKSSMASPSWEIERNLADKIMEHVMKHRLDLKLDKLTRGKGNCFMIAVLQQLKQDHVYNVSSLQIQKLADEFCHQKFRKAIKNFALHSSDKNIHLLFLGKNIVQS